MIKLIYSIKLFTQCAVNTNSVKGYNRDKGTQSFVFLNIYKPNSGKVPAIFHSAPQTRETLERAKEEKAK